MEQLGNILEALRFAGDQLKDKKMDTGILTLHHAIETVNILWHIGKVQDQKILMAAALHQIPRIEEELKIGVQDIFGKEVYEFIHASLHPESLKAAYFERLKLKKNTAEQGGRKIYIAATCALLRYSVDQEDQFKQIKASEILKTRQEFIATFSGENPQLEDFLTNLLKETE